MTQQPVSLQPATRQAKETLSRLLHDYQLELARYTSENREDVGEYQYLPSYFTDPDRSAFLICAGDTVAGFVLVNTHTLLEHDAHSVAEFYVIPEFRLQGIGERAAELVFRKFPGKWEVAQMDTNTPAIRFWRNVIANVTNGQYRETQLATDAWRGPVQTFTIA